MIEVDGKRVYMTLDELVNVRHTALVVVDMQRDFCSPDGLFGQLGIDLSMYPPMIPRLARLIGGARRVGVMVVYIQMTTLRGRKTESPAQIRFNLRLHKAYHGAGLPLFYTLDGSLGQQIMPELAPAPDDLIVKKYRSSGFWGTNLDMLLRSNGIETAIITGCTTEGCVESTARDALFNDYYVVVPEDCVGSDDPRQHEASLFLMQHRFDVVTSAAILECWGQDAEGTRDGDGAMSAQQSASMEPARG
jgi:nicotinamidase-related amidase